ncbi:stalk domain-containing protein [Cohnella sp. JJ-181]|uniref:stalk domain-containing protein n=1 Tax=Cohnella rhizoplanae TaxID=2974897 RepID=UPI00232DEF91|nr:stalk domain-containing protein [Cohnella sp. JJ-181]
MGLALVAMLIAVLVGCQAVGGVNLNEVLTKQLDVRSSAGSGSFEIELNWDEDALAEEDAETQRLVKLFSKVKLQLDQAQSDDKGNVKASGKLSLGKGDIPFALQIDPTTVLLTVEGAKRPLLIDAGEFGEGLMPGEDMMVPGLGDMTSKIAEEAFRDALKQVGSYVVGHLPNPPRIQAEAVQLPINGTPTDLMKVHAELNGKELGELIPVFLDSLLSDGQGVRSLLERLAAWASDLPPELKEALGIAPEDTDWTQEEVTQAAQELLDGVKELRDEYDEASREEDWQETFNESLTFKADLYADKSLHIRKSDVEIALGEGLFTEEDLPLKGVVIRTSQELWNINEDVGLGEVAAPANAMTVEELANLNPRKLLNQLSVNSVVYDVLKNDMEIDDQSFTLSSDWGVPFASDDDGNLYVPVKETMRQLGNPITFEAKTKQIRFYDEPTVQEFVLTLGSDQALVNGEKVQLQAPVARLGGVSYMSADDLLGLLHATYTLSEGYDGEQLMDVERDL